MTQATDFQPFDALANAGPKELLVAATVRRLRAPGGAALLEELQAHIAAAADRADSRPIADSPRRETRSSDDAELAGLAAEARAWFKAGARRSQLKSASERRSVAHGLDLLSERGELAAEIAAFRADCAERPDCAPEWIRPEQRIRVMMRRQRPFEEIAREAAWLRRLAEASANEAKAA